MRLKRVKLFGFKTFADRTEFDVDGDLIAVVGPNGCGKSNLVDAILWGLGEGNARQLRAQSGVDVIFNGSSRRKPLGFAEVSLLFDNEDGSLPVDASEVAISRRLTRSGESEYSINRRTCRLRDVVELLADSGLGRSGYSIVGQKEIDQALAASADDRRAWVDEAAGVQRYRMRKAEAVRRLAGARQSLERIRDILTEIETQREPLREEAETAKRYKAILGSLREVESNLLITEVARAVEEIARHQKAVEEAMEMAAKESSLADELEVQARLTADQLSALESDMDAVRARQQAALTALERAEGAIRLAEQKLSSLREAEKNLGEEGGATQERLAEAEAELVLFQEEFEREKENLERVRAECSGAGEDARGLARQIESIDGELAAAREAQQAALRAEAEAQHRKSRIRDAKRELEGIQQTLPDLRAAVQEAQKADDEASEAIAAIEKEIASCREHVRAIESEEEQSAQSVRRWLAEKAALEGRRRGIEATIEAHEGLNQGVRAVLEAVERGVLTGEYTPVGDAIEVGRDLALAIETALGGAVNDLIVDDEADAKRAIDWLKQHRLGRATFQPIPLMRPFAPSADLQRVLNERGVVGRASDLVQCAGRHRPVIDSLLGRVVVVRDLDAALKLARTSGWSRLVTIDGEVVHSSGAVTGGVSSKTGYGLVQRRADLAELGREIDALERSLAQAERASADRMKRREKYQDRITALRSEAAAKSKEAAQTRSWLQSLNDELQTTVRAGKKLEEEIAKLREAESPKFSVPDIEALEQGRDALLRQLAARTADAEQAEARLREAEERLAQATQRLQQAERRLAQAKDAEQTRQKRLVNLGPERDRAKSDIERAEADRERAAKDRQAAEAQLAEWLEQKRILLEESFRLSEQAKDARRNALGSGDRAHQAELNRARADARRATALQRLIEEYGLSEEDAVERAPRIELPPDAAALTARFRRELKALGDVNLGAIEAYERLNERHEELNAQYDDVQRSIEEVETSVRELDQMTRERFRTTFEAVRDAFEETFKSLFPGGEGQLALTQPDDLLESGIEIDVTLPGKKKQRLELLSGGERSLCATAFLFALLKVKPSPLVVLDEVDAPLDGRNVERFLELLAQFRGSTQFIVITHNPTTIEAAPVWLGVTMQEPGVSTLVPAKLGAAPIVEGVLTGSVPNP